MSRIAPAAAVGSRLAAPRVCGASPGSRAARFGCAAIANAVLALAGCGGKHGDTTPSEPTGGDATAAPSSTPSSEQMVSPDTMDEINRSLSRKRQSMSRCLALAIDNKELPRAAKGKVTVELVIAPSGKADDVKIVRATVESRMLNECVIGRVKEIQFPELPKPYQTSYTYGFEAM
jgi:outer membrane biosynthesis protein TonB